MASSVTAPLCVGILVRNPADGVGAVEASVITRPRNDRPSSIERGDDVVEDELAGCDRGLVKRGG